MSTVWIELNSNSIDQPIGKHIVTCFALPVHEIETVDRINGEEMWRGVLSMRLTLPSSRLFLVSSNFTEVWFSDIWCVRILFTVTCYNYTMYILCCRPGGQEWWSSVPSFPARSASLALQLTDVTLCSAAAMHFTSYSLLVLPMIKTTLTNYITYDYNNTK